MAENLLKNIALLIDADNVNPAGIDAVLTVLAELGHVNIRRAYGNWAKQTLHRWEAITHRFGIMPHQQFDVTKGKNATDMAMTIDAMDLLYLGKVDGFGIMSSDSDFTPLVTRLRQDGLTVYGFGDDKTPEALRTVCTRFINMAGLIEIQDKDERREPPKPTSDAKIDDAVIDALLSAWNASRQDKSGFVALAQMGQFLNRLSSVDARTYGFKRLAHLVEAANDHFQVERRSDGAVYVKRLS